jgi:hypothetical protein
LEEFRVAPLLQIEIWNWEYHTLNHDARHGGLSVKHAIMPEAYVFLDQWDMFDWWNLNGCEISKIVINSVTKN